MRPLLAATSEVLDVGDLIGTLTGAAVLGLVLVLLLRGDLVTKRSHESILDRCSDELAKAEADRDQWRDVAMDALQVTEQAVGRKR